MCLRVPDIYKARDFYEKALGAVVVAEWGKDEDEDHAFIMDIGEGDYLEIYGSSESWKLGYWQHVAVWTDDINAAMDLAEACGAKRIREPDISHIPCRSGQVVGMKYAYVEGPGGESIEFIEDIPEVTDAG